MATQQELEQEEEEQEIAFDFIPEIECDSCINGAFQLRVTNITQLWLNNQFHAFDDICFELMYRRMNSNLNLNSCNINNNTNYDKEIDGIWRRQEISVGSVCDNGIMYFKVNVFLYDYNFEFYLKTMNVITKQWMTASSIHTINIASFLKDENFKVGQNISFRDIKTFSTTDGEIVEILKDNVFKIKYLKYDNKKNGFRMLRSSYIDTIENVDISRLYHKSTQMQYEIDLIDSNLMDKHLLIQSNDQQTIDIFHALNDALQIYSQTESDIIYGKERSIINWKGMNTFVSKNIFDFLFQAQFKYSVYCIIESDSHNTMDIINLRQSDIRTKYELIKHGIGNVLTHVFQHDNICYACDFCRCSIKEMDFVFQCRAGSYLNRHDYCVNCINTIITLNGKLTQLLGQLLINELITDCVQVIVDYVIGRVVCIQLNENINKNNNNKRKKINHMLMPTAKRRKLNQ